MTQGDITGLIICCVVAALLLAVSVALLTGHGSWLIAGFNTMSDGEKKKFDRKKLCRFTGALLLPIALLLPLLAAAGIYKIMWLVWVFIAVTLGSGVFGIIWMNTGNRFSL